MRSKLLIGVVVLVVVIGVGVGVGLLAGRAPSHVPPAATTIADNSAPQPAQPPTHFTPPPQAATPEITNSVLSVPRIPTVQPDNLVAATNAASTNDWEEKIDDIVGSDDPDTNKVAKLYALFPKLPPDGQEEAAQHLSNLVDDDEYAPLGEMLKNDKLPEGVLDELLADVLNRPNNLKLPELLAVASDPNHAKHDEAKDLLELYLGEDYGSDWNSWGQHMTNWMQQNPD
ncbi:MAG TPA: hypothetical protein VHC44_15290 [Verrucomicrobiae bacterium]|nr:hypothetical protein [Verrucomicrobiae bacterium]